ncbi:hypothetical protein [Pseudomonas sp. R5(2019)]|uniref:hypothetical protein n=1 Tax=Pseudomonas sp. R5(2019) TaxID=2697566 RepID=UPI0014133757|nr:hypothetical protein [Pseudomonas sp. R5(2019)]NBA95239.1 hypothetical protein [Pseudomonas sp. R5(2019)]
MTLNVDKEIALAHLAAAGWALDEYNQSNPIESHAIYVHDFRCNKLKVVCIEREQFSKSHGFPSLDASVNALCWLLGQSFKGTLTQADSGAMFASIVDYLRETQSYRVWRGQAALSERMHAVLNIYPGSGQPWVRPFIIKSDRTVVDAEAVIDVSKQVATQDKVRHPEWF